MTTAFVLSGGAALGAAQVGMAAALADAGIRPDLIVGASVGAVNGGWIAARRDPDGLDELGALWQGLRRNDVFPVRPVLGLAGFLGRRPNLVPDTALRRLVADNIRFTRLEDAPVPLHVIVTDVLTGKEVCLSSGDTVDAILASAAIPAVFPPVRLDGRDYMDGGVVNNTPVSHAIALGADTIWVLSTGYACALPEAPRGALAMALHALTLSLNQRLVQDVERYQHRMDLRVVPPLCPVRTSPIDFNHAAELIARARASTSEWLAAGSGGDDQASHLALHSH